MVEGGDDRKSQEFFCLFIFVSIYSSYFPPKYKRMCLTDWEDCYRKYQSMWHSICGSEIDVNFFFTRIIWRKISFYLFIFLSIYFGVYLTNIYYVLCTVWSTGDQRKCKVEVGLQLLYVGEKWSSQAEKLHNICDQRENCSQIIRCLIVSPDQCFPELG